ncbi:MAG: glycoside hydrolase [Calditrichaeota bacterium]|nr:MAG: glycoside hydrolase [Calditrichota bacterium]
MVKVSPRSKKVTFQVELPEAESVALVGDFNGWDASATPMKKTRTGVWKADVKLEAGEYQFRYLVNGREWLNDNQTPQVPNVFGTHNSFIQVEFPAPSTRKSSGKAGGTRKKAAGNGKAGK